LFWSAVRQLAPGVERRRRLVGIADGDIAELFERAGLVELSGVSLSLARIRDFDDFSEAFTFAVGPAIPHRSRSSPQ
jgi:hypothetical protein